MLFVAGGVGAAPVYPQVKWLHEHGIEADVIVGSKTKDMLILEDEMKAVAGNYYPCTDDGSYGHAGMVTTKIEQLVKEEGKKYDVYCKYESNHGRWNRYVRGMQTSGWR